MYFHYLVLTKLEYPSKISLTVKGLTVSENETLSEKFTKENITYKNSNTDYMEIDLAGYQMLNILSENFGYRVASQAMAMELSSLGGRSFQIEKIVWTLEKEIHTANIN